MKAANHFNPDTPFRSILRQMPGSPSDRVTLACAAAGINRTGLAALVGVHYVQLSRVLNGHADDPDTRARVAQVFGLVVSDFWPESDNEQAAA